MLKVPASERDQIHEAGDADQISRWEQQPRGHCAQKKAVCGSKRKKTGGKIKQSGLRRGARSRVVLGAGCGRGSGVSQVVRVMWSCRVVSRVRSNQVGYSRISMREIFGEETEIYLKKSGLRPKALEIIPVSPAPNERRWCLPG
jgi:hypothetical protein